MPQLLKILPLFYYHLVAFPILVALLLLFKTKTKRAQLIALYAMSALCVVFYLVNDYHFYLRGTPVLAMLPLQLCNIGVFLIPLALLTNKTLLLDFAFYLSVPGALAALLTPNADYSHVPYSMITISFYISHFMIMAIPLLLAGWKLYPPRPTIKKALSLSATILILASCLHLLNLLLNRHAQISANYFFTIIKYSTPINPVFAFLAKLIPHDLLYLLPALLILYLYMAVVFLVTRRTSVPQPG